jgi:hypothetical protein
LLLLLLSLLTLLPTHDFHTSWMNFTYNEKQKEFDITWRTDTEHLEAVLSKRGNSEVILSNETIDSFEFLLNLYVDENVDLYINKKRKAMKVDVVEVNFAETIVHFKPIKYRRKIKSFAMSNVLLTEMFPGQQNMVQLNYKGKTGSMLFEGTHTYSKLKDFD